MQKRTFLLGLPTLASYPVLTMADTSFPSYKWLPTECAPLEYPMYLISGVLKIPGHPTVYIPDRRDVHNGWGLHGSTHIVGDMKKPIPSELSLKWFSYTENCFYTCDVVLPRKAIDSFFATPWVLTADPLDEGDRMDTIIVGMAPLGYVTLWLSNRNEVVEILNTKGTRKDLPWTLVLNNPEISREHYIAQTLEKRFMYEQLKYRGSMHQNNRYSLYAKRFSWQPWITGINNIGRIRVTCWNGERFRMDEKGSVIPKLDRTTPRLIELWWSDSNNKSHLTECSLDDAETMDALSDACSESGSTAALRMHYDSGIFSIGVQTRTSARQLKKVQFKHYQS